MEVMLTLFSVWVNYDLIFISIFSIINHFFDLDMVGTKNANNIISISNEGLLCTWDIREMTKP
jgi:hypothetical protein